MTLVSASSRVSELATALAGGGFPWAGKAGMLAAAKDYWNPGKTQFWQDEGVPLVIDQREGYFLHDVEGKTLIDVHRHLDTEQAAGEGERGLIMRDR